MPDDGSKAVPRQPPDDDAWAARVSLGVQRGDRDSLAEFYSEWFDRSLLLAALATGRDETFCLDVVQDAMVKVASRLKKVETAAQLSAWMRRVLLSCAMDRLRDETARSRRQRVAQQLKVGAPVDAEIDIEERLAWLEQELSVCTAEDQLLLRQRIVDRATLEQAGAFVGKTGAVAHGRIRRLIESLRKAGKARFEDA